MANEHKLLPALYELLSYYVFPVVFFSASGSLLTHSEKAPPHSEKAHPVGYVEALLLFRSSLLSVTLSSPWEAVSST